MCKSDNQIPIKKLITFLQSFSNENIDLLELSNWIEINTNYQSTIIHAYHISTTLDYLESITDFAIQVEKTQRLIIKRLLFHKQDNNKI